MIDQGRKFRVFLGSIAIVAGFRSRLIIPSKRSGLAALVALLVVLWPLPYGSVTPSALLGLRVSAGLLLALALAVERDWERPLRLKWAVIGLAGLALLGWLQSAMWPHSIASRISPRHVELAGRVSQIGRTSEGVRLSVAPTASQSAAISALSLVALLVVASVVGRHARHRRLLAMAIMLSAVVQVLLGLRPWLSGTVPRLTGRFVNPDHLAVQLEIALCVGLVVLFGVLKTTRFGVATEFRLLLVAAVVLSLATLLIGLLATGSRAGLLAAVAGLGVGVGLFVLSGPRSRFKWLEAGAGLALLAGVLVLGRGIAFGSVDRLFASSWHDVGGGGRIRVWQQAARLIEDFPWLGTGLGTFEEAFPTVQSADLTGILWGRAHNDFLELLITGGVIGCMLGLVVLVGLVGPLLALVFRGWRTEDRLAAVGALAALTAVGIHEFFDFGASLPSNAALLTVLCGAALSARLTPK